jgi:hypothetical protein
MPAAAASHTTQFRRLKIALAWVIVGAAICAPIALASFATAHPPRLPVAVCGCITQLPHLRTK